MTVTTTARKAGPFVGNGVTTAFPFVFKVFANTDVVVTQAIAGVESTLVLATDYTVALNGDQDGNPGGNVNMLVAPDATKTLVITSNVPQTQSTVTTNNGGFFPSVFNTVFDRLTILVQQLAEIVGRSITIPKTAAGVTSLQIPVVANGMVMWSADGTQLLAVPGATAALVPALPNMATHGGQFLTTDGVATASWAAPLPAQGGNNGKFLTTSGAAASWSTLPVQGIAGIRAIVGADTVIATDKEKLLQCNGTFTLGFTAAATLGAQFGVYIQNTGTGAITLDPNAAEQIDGLTNFIMYPGEVRLVFCTGAAWTSIVLNPFNRVVTTTDAGFVWPPGYQAIIGEGWGGGGSGAGGGVSGGSGGGGGFGMPFVILASQYAAGATATLTIGAGGASTTAAAGNAGGTSSIAALFSFFGGGGGQNATVGGGGGGARSAGSGSTPGNPTGTQAGVFGGGQGGSSSSGTDTAFGGGGGGGSNGSSTGFAGGSSTWGAAGGGGTFPATAGAAGGTSLLGGAGGAGGSTGVAGGVGVAGSAPGGAGGGGCGNGVASGAGARGEIRMRGVI